MPSVLRQTTVTRDGLHNAFTDLVFWDGCYWISYRKGAAHVSMDGQCSLAVSADRARFREAAQLKVPGDNRDPKLIALNDGRLAMYFPSWLGGYQRRHLQQYVSFSADGFQWSTPQPVHQPHWWLWRIVEHGGRYYSAAYTYLQDTPEQARGRCVDLLVSEDLLRWESLGRIPEVNGGETGMHFEEDGRLWLVTRNAERLGGAYLSVAAPPYRDWETVLLQEAVHCPVILQHRGRLFVSGRRFLPLEDPLNGVLSPGTAADNNPSLGIWLLEPGRITPWLSLPACGDCAYPGLIEDPEGRVCLSYYSQHAYALGVLPQGNREPDAEGKSGPVPRADIYFAELDLSPRA